MAGDNQAAEGPSSTYSYKVKFGQSLEGFFQELTGMDTPTPTAYRSGDSQGRLLTKMPSQPKATLTLKKGVCSNDSRFWDWYNQVRMNTAPRDRVEIYLQDQMGRTQMNWLVKNGLVTNLQVPDLNAKGNNIAIESLELTYEGLEIKSV